MHDLAEKVRRGEPLPFPLGGLLSAATPLVHLSMVRRLRQPAIRVTAFVISMGNLTVGGTGKTPAVIERAAHELGLGRKVAVLTRGYGTANAAEVVSSREIETSRHCDMLGDEPALILRKLPDLVVLKSPNRLASAYRAIDEYGCNVLILDDGYQYTHLERDENILLIDAVNPFGNGRLLPRGILREPMAAMSRAHAIVLTRCDQARDIDRTEAEIRRYNSTAPIRRTVHAPVGLRDVRTGERPPLETLRGQTVRAVCGIGHPEAFFRTLESLGAAIQERAAVRDHAPIPAESLRGSVPTIVTEKDAVRLSGVPENVFALSVELRDFASSFSHD